jgi:hypothetical protein
MQDGAADSVFKLLSWKQQFGSVYSISVSGDVYVYRALTKAEHSFLMDFQERPGFDLEEAMISRCLLVPDYNREAFEAKPAGVVTHIAQCIGKSSGFSETDKVEKDIEEQRVLANRLDTQIIVLICKAFPHLTLEDIDNFTYDQMIRYLGISESVLGVKLNIEKPKTKNQGTVDFDAENKVMGAVPFDRNLNRGDVSKK